MQRLLFFLFMILCAVVTQAQERQTWSTVARGTSLPTVIPRSGYLFYRTADTTLHVSNGLRWLQLAAGDNAINSASIVNNSIVEADINWAQQNTDSVSSRVTGILNSQIANNTIVNADINSSAAIVGTKLGSNTLTDTQINWAQQTADSVWSAMPTKSKQITFKFSFLDTVLVGDSLMIANEPFAWTADSICASTNTGTATLFFDHRGHTAPRTRGTNIEAGGIVADEYERSSAFDDATIPANAPVFCRVTATASNVKQIWVTVYGRKD